MYGPTENGYASLGALSAFSLCVCLYVSMSLPRRGQRINQDAMPVPFYSFHRQIFRRAFVSSEFIPIN